MANSLTGSVMYIDTVAEIAARNTPITIYYGIWVTTTQGDDLTFTDYNGGSTIFDWNASSYGGTTIPPQVIFPTPVTLHGLYVSVIDGGVVYLYLNR